MASRADTMQYVVDQLAGLGGVTTRRMFGEYAIYLQGKVIGFICDDQFYLKPTDAGARLLESPNLAAPWVGAKQYFLITDELEQRELFCRLAQVTANALPVPKPKPAKAESNAAVLTKQPKKVAKKVATKTATKSTGKVPTKTATKAPAQAAKKATRKVPRR